MTANINTLILLSCFCIFFIRFIL